MENGLLTGVGKHEATVAEGALRPAARSHVRRDRVRGSPVELQELRAEGRNARCSRRWRAPCRRRSASKQIDPDSAAQLRGPRRRLALGAFAVDAARGNLRRRSTGRGHHAPRRSLKKLAAYIEQARKHRGRPGHVQLGARQGRDGSARVGPDARAFHRRNDARAGGAAATGVAGARLARCC